jgi:hypothetical protein
MVFIGCLHFPGIHTEFNLLVAHFHPEIRSIGGQMPYALRDSTGRKTPVGLMLRIGRDPANQIILNDPRVAPFHATLGEHQGVLILRNESSSAGTFVNHAPIQGSVALRAGDQVSICGAVFVVEPHSGQAISTPPARPPARGLSCCALWPALVIVVLSLACILPLGAAYSLYKNRSAQQQLLPLVGVGPASIEVENLSDNPVYLLGTDALDRSVGDSTQPEFEWTLAPWGTNVKTDQKAGGFRIDFGTKAGEMDRGTCSFKINAGEVYHFVILDREILIDRIPYPPAFKRNPASPVDLLVRGSSLCKYVSPK